MAGRIVPTHKAYDLLVALVVYAALSITTLAFAWGRHVLSHGWRYGLSTLFLSDLLILLGQILHVPKVRALIGPLYLLSLLLIAYAICRGSVGASEERPLSAKKIGAIFIVGGTLALSGFALAMYFFPHGGYNPCKMMLSTLGRTAHRRLAYPTSYYLFTAGLSAAALTTALLIPALATLVKSRAQRSVVTWSGTMVAAGLFAIALVPEDVSNFWHNAGCLAAVGGGAMLLLVSAYGSRERSVVKRWGWVWWSIALVAVFSAFILAHKYKLLSFSPYVPTTQKMLILTYIAWLAHRVSTLTLFAGTKSL